MSAVRHALWVLALIVGIGTAHASAQWQSRKDGPDVFGNMKVTAKHRGLSTRPHC
jgi:hypothetical protein